MHWLLLLFVATDPEIAGLIEQSLTEMDWQIAADIRDNEAVILKQVLKINKDSYEHFIRIRVLTEKGRNAPDSIQLPQEITELRGRICDRSGVVTTFDLEHNVVQQLDMKSRDDEESHYVLIPPGITGDCVFEMYWSEPTKEGLPKDLGQYTYPILSPYPCVEKTVFIWHALDNFSKLLYSDAIFTLITRYYWTRIEAPTKFTQQILGDFIVLNYRDVPPARNYPYGAPEFDQRAARFVIYKTLPVEEMSVEEFWNETSYLLFKSLFETVYEKGANYREWIAQLRAEMPSLSPVGARYVHNEFKKKIHCVTLLGHQRRTQISLNAGPLSASDTELINRAFHRGFAFPSNMAILLYHVLRDCGFPAEWVFTTPDLQIPFRPQDMNVFSLDIDRPLIGIWNRNGEAYYFAAAQPEVPAGFAPEAVMGGKGLVVNPKNWHHRVVEMPKYPRSTHKLLRKFNGEFRGDGLLRFNLQEKGTGAFDARHRASHFGLTPEEQSRALGREMRQRMPGWRIRAAHVAHAYDPHKEILLTASGERTTPVMDNVALIPAFPDNQDEVGFPYVWPDDRSQPVLLPYAFSLVELSEWRVPTGWAVVVPTDSDYSSEAGRVKITSEVTGDLVRVRRDVLIDQWLFPADQSVVIRDLLWAWNRDRGLYIKLERLP